MHASDLPCSAAANEFLAHPSALWCSPEHACATNEQNAWHAHLLHSPSHPAFFSMVLALPSAPLFRSEEDSGELAAMSALQRRRKSVAPGSAQKVQRQRFGSWFEGDDKELEHTLHVSML